jgi:hypothetical protein
MGTYQAHKDVLLSRHFVPAAYTFAGGSTGPVAADADGERIIYAGQVVSVDSATGKAYPHSVAHAAQNVVGVLIEDVNVRDGDEASTIIVEGWVDENLCIDLDVFGAVGTSAKTALANRVNFTKRGL